MYLSDDNENLYNIIMETVIPKTDQKISNKLILSHKEMRNHVSTHQISQDKRQTNKSL